MDVLKVLNKLKELEINASELYDWFTNMFESDPQAMALFEKLNKDEISHSEIIQFQIQLVSKNRKQFKDIFIDMGEIDLAIAKIQSAMKAEDPPSLQQAVEFSLELEADIAETFYRTAILDSNFQVGKMINAIVKSENDHVDRLRKFAKDRAFDK